MSTSDIRVIGITPLESPRSYVESQPITPKIAAIVTSARTAIENIGNGTDPRTVLLVGPCPLHDEDAGLEYATRLAVLAEEVTSPLLALLQV